MREARGCDLVRRYYGELWNRWEPAVAEGILSPDFHFRGSLGHETRGVEAFLEYVRMVRGAFPDFYNTLEDVFEGPGFVVARLTYTGTHSGELFGIPPTQKSIRYEGVGIFRIGGRVLTEGWVVADRMALLEQLLGPGFWRPSGD